MTVLGNAAPIATTDDVTVAFGESVEIAPLANDTDPEGEELTLVSFDQPASGVVEAVYAAPAWLLDEYEYSGSYGGYSSIDDYVNDYYGGWEYVLGTGETSAIEALRYTATNPAFSGAAAFTYVVRDAAGIESTGQINVTVQGAASVETTDDVATIDPGGVLDIHVVENDANSSSLTLLSVTGATQGTAVIARDVPSWLQSEYDSASYYGGYSNINEYVASSYGGWESISDAGPAVVRYTANADAVGEEILTYTVQNASGITAVGTVTITINAPAAPVAVDDLASVIATETAVIDVMGNDTDPANSALRLLTVSQATTGSVALVRRTPQVLQDQYEIDGGDFYFGSIDAYVSQRFGSWEGYQAETLATQGQTVDIDTFDVAYTAGGTAGTDTFTYTIENEFGVTSVGTVTVDVAALPEDDATGPDGQETGDSSASQDETNASGSEETGSSSDGSDTGAEEDSAQTIEDTTNDTGNGDPAEGTNEDQTADTANDDSATGDPQNGAGETAEQTPETDPPANDTGSSTGTAGQGDTGAETAEDQIGVTDPPPPTDEETQQETGGNGGSDTGSNTNTNGGGDDGSSGSGSTGNDSGSDESSSSDSSSSDSSDSSSSDSGETLPEIDPTTLGPLDVVYRNQVFTAADEESKAQLENIIGQLVEQEQEQDAVFTAYSESMQSIADERARIRVELEDAQELITNEHNAAAAAIEDQYQADLLLAEQTHTTKLNRIQVEYDDALAAAENQFSNEEATAANAAEQEVGSAQDAYDGTMQAAQDAFDAAKSAADTARQTAIDQATQVRDTAIAAAEDTAEQATDAANSAYDTAMANAQSVLDSALASAAQQKDSALQTAQAAYDAVIAANIGNASDPYGASSYIVSAASTSGVSAADFYTNLEST